ncbi:uncharacterized protein [Cardiocondyla obscurior]|uniref:uncharacterized protein n=1 Tax=Cardiocondyla obscurior TaxID=286306 RepID=UPI00396567AE
MRVKNASQVLSGTLASYIETLTRTKCTVTVDDEDVKICNEEGIATAEAINFFNDLFDSVNSDAVNIDDNLLRCPVTENSEHHELWIDAKQK